MTEFFIKTDTAAVGPFTGIELREAALSRIITVHSQIGPSTQGPWTVATETGLFSEARMPLPHPDGVHVPQYHVRGLSFAADGPFKLRELIGFAARGMMRSDASLQSDLASDWIPAQRLPILAACLNGELMVLGANGRKKGQGGGDKTSNRQDSASHQTTAPNYLTKSTRGAVNTEPNRTPLLSTGSFDDAVETKPTQSRELDESTKLATTERNTDPETDPQSDDLIPWWRRSIRMPHLNPTIRLSDLRVTRRVALSTIGLLLLSAGIATAVSRWQRMQLQPEQIMGTWIAEDDSFTVTFYESGDCVVFNTTGNSWSGEFEWIAGEEKDRTFSSSFTPNQLVESVVATVAPNDAMSDVESTDGYVRFRASALEPTFVGQQEMDDAFLRLREKELLIGYVTSIHWGNKSRRIVAGWKPLTPQPPIGIEPLSALAELEIEPPPKIGFAIERSPHVAIVASQLMTQYETGDLQSDSTNGLCYSVLVDADYLLQQYGAPDEARPVFPFDQASLPSGLDLPNSQLVRYGSLQLILSTDGKLRHISLVQ